jgi:winged helix DNA-binding protein
VPADVLTLRELNRATLHRQLLLRRTELSARGVVEHLVGMQAQWPSAPYVGIWSRSHAFRREALEDEVVAGRVVKATMMRQTLHLVTDRDYAVLRAALSEANWLHNTPAAERVAASLRALADGRHVTRADVLAHLEEAHGLTGIDAAQAWRGGRIRAHLVPHHETALWKARPEARYVAIDVPDAIDPVEARAEIVRRYLLAFGPASKADIARWSMMSISREINPALERLGSLKRFKSETGRELLDVADAPRPDGDTPSPVRFLPKWDNAILGYTDRTRILPEPFRPRVIKGNGDVKQTFLVDGFVAGTWRVDRERVHIEPFITLASSTREEIAEETAALEAFLR